MKFNITIDRDEDGIWVVECPAIPGCVSQGQTKEEALENIQDAIYQCLQVRAERGLPLTIETRQARVGWVRRAWRLPGRLPRSHPRAATQHATLIRTSSPFVGLRRASPLPKTFIDCGRARLTQQRCDQLRPLGSKEDEERDLGIVRHRLDIRARMTQ